jgi:DNA excision repair protein ERCC-4
MTRPKKDDSWTNYRVIRDTREQAGWSFPAKERCLGTVEGTLPTGDYSLAGYEDVLAVERKGTVAEFAQNVNESRFERELARLDSFMYPFVVLEFDLSDLLRFPEGTNIPRHLWGSLRVTPQFLLKRLNDFQVAHRAHFVFAGRFGRQFVSSLFKRVVDREKRPCPPSTDDSAK